MNRDMKNSSFVCLDDITGNQEPLNYVIYNPIKDSVSFRVDNLFKIIKECIGVELTSEQLIHLTKYDVTDLNDFVRDLQDIIMKAKEK